MRSVSAALRPRGGQAAPQIDGQVPPSGAADTRLLHEDLINRALDAAGVIDYVDSIDPAAYGLPRQIAERNPLSRPGRRR